MTTQHKNDNEFLDEPILKIMFLDQMLLETSAIHSTLVNPRPHGNFQS